MLISRVTAAMLLRFYVGPENGPSISITVVWSSAQEITMYEFKRLYSHCRSLFPGNGILRGRDSGVGKARHIQPIVSRDKGPARKPTNSALFALHPEISVGMGLRGGVGRTRTSNQADIVKR
jgi:hypothetical protein